VGGEGAEVEEVLAQFMLEALPLLVQAWAEAYQCAADAGVLGGAAGSHSVAVHTLGELVELLELAMFTLFEVNKRECGNGSTGGDSSALSRRRQLALGVCRSVMQNFPLDPERLRAASEQQVRSLNTGILLLVTAGLRTCRGEGGTLGAGATGPKLEKVRLEMLDMEEQLCCFVGDELSRAQAVMAAAQKAQGKREKREGIADRKELERAATAASESGASMIEALGVLVVAREERWGVGVGVGGGVGGYWEGRDAELLDTFTSCWQTSKSSTLCKKAGVVFIRQRLRRWWPHACPPVGREWVTALPKLLWTLQDRNEALSLSCLEIMTDLCRREHPHMRAQMAVHYSLTHHREHHIAAAATTTPHPAPPFSVISILQPLIVPFFRRSLPGGGGGYEAGPFFALPGPCQRAALKLLYYMAPISEQLLAAVAAALVLPEVGEDVVRRCLEMVTLLVDARLQVYMHLYICICICIRIRVCIYLYIFICICMHVCVYNTYVRVCIACALGGELLHHRSSLCRRW
jgi:hypothetical protein